jgi:protein-S-isoprenylcysteine O-methyltransferase Ste14
VMKAELLRIIAYLWAAFGAYWMLASQLKRDPTADGNSSRRPLRIGLLAVTLALLFVGHQRIPPLVLGALALAWAGIALQWTTSKNTSQSREFRFYRLLRLFILALTFCLLFWEKMAVVPLGITLLPDSKAIAIAGFLVTILGLAIAIWARVHLGRYWSDKVVLQENHKLIRSGPYAYVRHPIYSGVLLGVFGTSVVLGEVRGTIAFLLLLTNYIIKARREDDLLSQQFPTEFSVHQKHAGFLLPRFH